MQSIMQSGRWPGNKAIGTYVIDSESKEAAASSASMLGTPMYPHPLTIVGGGSRVLYTACAYRLMLIDVG